AALESVLRLRPAAGGESGLRAFLSAAVARAAPQLHARLQPAHPPARVHRGDRDVLPPALAEREAGGVDLRRAVVRHRRTAALALSPPAIPLLGGLAAVDRALRAAVLPHPQPPRLRPRRPLPRHAGAGRRADDAPAD